MKSYFFIPANRKTFLEKASQIQTSNIIIDLEDALFNSNINEAVNNILDFRLSVNSYVRLAFDLDFPVDQLNYVQKLVEYGFNKFVLPKIEGRKDIDSIVKVLSSWSNSNEDFEIVVLVENPKAILNLSEILSQEFVRGVGLGSHDYCAVIGMNHTFENIYWARMQILNTGKAMGKEVIDIASMNLEDKKDFSNECFDAFKKGFDAKFIIHPWQLNIFNSLHYYTNEEIRYALVVKEYIQNIGGESHFTIAKIEEKVIEKPHLARIKQILKTIGNGSF